MAQLKYGWVEGDGKGREYPVAASQYFSRRGGKFVTIDSAGHVKSATLISSALLGWAESGKDAAGANYWKSSSTAGKDKVFVVYGLGNMFEMPVDTSVASANATLVGKGGCISATTNNSTNLQYFKYKATTASCMLSCHDFDKTNQTAVVRIRPESYIPS